MKIPTREEYEEVTKTKRTCSSQMQKMNAGDIIKIGDTIITVLGIFSPTETHIRIDSPLEVERITK